MIQANPIDHSVMELSIGNENLTTDGDGKDTGDVLNEFLTGLSFVSLCLSSLFLTFIPIIYRYLVPIFYQSSYLISPSYS